MSESISPLKPKRTKPPKQPRYGEIPGFPVGTRWEDREHMYQDGFHLTLQAGIQGREQSGACSIVLSTGYEDDVDLGEEFTYTGSGGQKHRNDKDRRQQRDQEWKRGNQALKMSCLLQKPVRVIRSFRLKSEYAPTEGYSLWLWFIESLLDQFVSYRYDGLYDVVEAERKPGKSGHLVCLFRLVRCGGQLPLPGRNATLPMRQKGLQIPRSESPALASASRGSSVSEHVARPMFVEGSSTTPYFYATHEAEFAEGTSSTEAEEIDELEGSEVEDLKYESDDTLDKISDQDISFPSGYYEDSLEDGEVVQGVSDVVHEAEIEEGEIP
ncbi:hypothetical protein GALMADRAFT_266451 [Galerina marginata CBS 339.88]|uniref:YDG domain-containing protein n=1 Tax=Galerina marginata (strain CBS 339.88) TaxID=685588 RepID=A0A067T7E0_GALM3|nr:hypothetical protein GALMADRAFT_266451 [Galerina marginata CBS 339.88]